MDSALFLKYQQATSLVTKAVNRIEYPSDELKLEMNEFFNPKDKAERALLFGAFAKYHHGKIRDAFITCKKGFFHTGEEKYRSLKYMIGIIKKLK